MKVFVWQNVRKVSENYHEGGGVVVFAEDEAAARALANAVFGCALSDDETPDDVRDVIGGEPRVYIMPDAGCC